MLRAIGFLFFMWLRVVMFGVYGRLGDWCWHTLSIPSLLLKDYALHSEDVSPSSADHRYNQHNNWNCFMHSYQEVACISVTSIAAWRMKGRALIIQFVQRQAQDIGNLQCIPPPPSPRYDLWARFIVPHKADFSTALAEINVGRKRSCWSWYIFPVGWVFLCILVNVLVIDNIRLRFH